MGPDHQSMGFEVDLVLATLDASAESTAAAEYAVAIAREYAADVHVLYLFDDRLRQGIDYGDVRPSTLADHQQSLTAALRERLPPSVDLTASSARGYSPDRLGHTPGTVALDTAEELAADFIVVPRETPGDDPDAVIGKAALHVIEYASQPVLSV